MKDMEKERILSQLEKTKKGLPITKRFKDYWVKGLQLHPCYREDWDEIKDVFDDYSIDMKHQGPIITMQTLEEVKLARNITKELAKDARIRKMAEKVCYPLRNVYPNPKLTKDKLIEGTIFIVVLRLIPSFCMKIGTEKLNKFVSNGIKYDILESLFDGHGTIRETQHEFEDSVKVMIKKLSDSPL